MPPGNQDVALAAQTVGHVLRRRHNAALIIEVDLVAFIGGNRTAVDDYAGNTSIPSLFNGAVERGGRAGIHNNRIDTPSKSGS